MRAVEQQSAQSTTTGEASSAVAGKATLSQHDTARASAFDGAQWENVEPTAQVARKKHEHKDGLAETLAKIGQEVLNKIADKILGELEKLTEYSPHEANQAKELLEHLAATCGPSSAALQRQVRVAAHKIGGFHFAKFLRKGMELARDMAGACKDLHDNFDKDGLGAVFKFIGAAFGTAKAWADAVHDHVKAIHEVDHLVARIGTRCGKKPEIEIPETIEPLIVKRPSVTLQLDPGLAKQLGSQHSLHLPGIQLPGHHSVIPKPVLEIHGPVVTLGA